MGWEKFFLRETKSSIWKNEFIGSLQDQKGQSRPDKKEYKLSDLWKKSRYSKQCTKWFNLFVNFENCRYFDIKLEWEKNVHNEAKLSLWQQTSMISFQ